MSDLLQMKMKDWNLCPVFFAMRDFLKSGEGIAFVIK